MELQTQHTNGSPGTLQSLVDFKKTTEGLAELQMQQLKNEFFERKELLLQSQENLKKESRVLAYFLAEERDKVLMSNIQFDLNETLKGQTIKFWLTQLSYNPVYTILCEVINHYNSELKLPEDRKLSMNEIQAAASEIISRFPYLFRITEIIYCLHKGTRGDYGTMYHRFDLNILFTWLDKYLEELTDHRESKVNDAKAEHGFVRNAPSIEDDQKVIDAKNFRFNKWLEVMQTQKEKK